MIRRTASSSVSMQTEVIDVLQKGGKTLIKPVIAAQAAIQPVQGTWVTESPI